DRSGASKTSAGGSGAGSTSGWLNTATTSSGSVYEGLSHRASTSTSTGWVHAASSRTPVGSPFVSYGHRMLRTLRAKATLIRASWTNDAVIAHLHAGLGTPRLSDTYVLPRLACSAGTGYRH